MIIAPLGPLGAYKTYSLRMPSDMQVKTACEDAGCDAFTYGWITTVPTGSAQARYIRRESGRTFKEQRDGTLSVFTFASGQRCFAEHRTRPELYSVTGAHWQAGTARPLIREHVRAADWVEDFAEHQQGLADEQAKG